MTYLLLFLVSLGAATLLPISSEATLLYELHAGAIPWLLLLAAGTGNVLGSVINYWIGRKGTDYLLSTGKLTQKHILRSERLFDRYGGFALLLSWAPIIGDPITLVAGVLHYPFRRFLLFVTIAKFGRYLLLIAGYVWAL
jgi:membrane protein YqaA with SNARE-associated domain